MKKLIQTTVPADFFAVMRERVAVLLNMQDQNLKLDWAYTYDLPQLTACCERMEASMPGIMVSQDSTQRELIQNPDFAAYYAKLLEQFPEEPPVETKPEPSNYGNYNRRYGGYSRYEPPRPPSRRAMLTGRLGELLEACRAEDVDITAYPQAEVMEALALDQLADGCRLVYLRHFAPMKLNVEKRQNAAVNLSNCVEVPPELSESQKTMLLKPFVGDCNLFLTAPFGEACALLTAHPELEEIAAFLHEMEISEHLELEHYRRFAENVPEYRGLILSVLGGLGPVIASAFMGFWQRSGCSLRELQTMERRLNADMDMDLASVFSNYAGYVNLLYGSRFKAIDLAGIHGWQEDILLYAIVNNKKHFIRLVDAHPETFLALPSTSLLSIAALYREHLNLNELTREDLAACAWMNQSYLNVERLMPGRVYTFPELRVLYDAGDAYVSLYNRLTAERQDDRLLVLRQLLKRDLLKGRPKDDELDALASRLSMKPLDHWMQDDFAHISGLTAHDAVQLLIHLDAVRRLLPTFKTQTDALLALRNLDCLSQFGTVDELKAHIVQVDRGWASLAEDMGLTDDFQTRHEEGIVRFLCRNGAYIANTYRSDLDEQQQKAFLRVVKAELMGQLKTMKYFDGDLQKELDLSISQPTVECWKENTSVTQKNIEADEYDDFFSTMLLGVQPQRTCLAYDGGVYQNCLLSGFDSNKKVLYATQNGRIVGRAFLRLTKGRPTGTDTVEKDAFTFVDLEHIGDSRKVDKQPDEYLALFLERPYTNGVNRQIKENVMKTLIELARRKADALGARLVLSRDYHGIPSEGFTYTKFYIYISRTKAGAQYLDSLNGEATVDTEGSYKANTFLIREAARSNRMMA